MKNMNELNFEGLKRLNDVKDFEIADNYSDIRGWKVFSGNKKEIGYVTDLIIDLISMKVIYADICLNEDISDSETQQNIFVPIINTFLDEKKKIIHIPAIETGTILKMPALFQGIPLKDYASFLENTKSIPKPTDAIFKRDAKWKVKSSHHENFARLKDYTGTRVKTSTFNYVEWGVLSLDNKNIGKVNDVIFDTLEKSIRYLEVKTGFGLLGQNKIVLIPIGIAHLSESDDFIVVELNKISVNRLPEYSGDPITRNYELNLREVIKSEILTYDDLREDFYCHHHFDESNFYKYRVKQES